MRELKDFEHYYTANHSNYAKLNFDAIILDIKNKKLDWSRTEDLLIIHTDRLNNVKTEKRSTTREDNVNATTIFVRDATNAHSLKNRLPPSHLAHQMSNTLIRALNTLRGIDHLLNFYKNSHVEHQHAYLQQVLKNTFINLLEKIKQLQDEPWCFYKASKLKNLHKQFNSELIKIIHLAGLDHDAITAADPEKYYHTLLMHYRNLAATLKPMPAVKTISKIANNTFIQTVDPITQKTDEQKKALETLDTVTEPTQIKVVNYQSSQPLAIQLANKAFKDFLTNDNTQLGAQARFIIPHGVRHAFWVTNQFGDSQQITLRCSSTAAVADGMTESDRQQATTECLNQIVQFIKTKRLNHDNKQLEHIILLERSRWRTTGGRINQVTMHDLMREATSSLARNDPDANKVGFSSMPMSFYAMLTKFANPLQPSPTLLSQTTKQIKPKTGIQSTANRTQEIAAMIAESTNNKLVMYGCASNVNRAGAVSILLAANEISARTQLPLSTASDNVVETGHETFVGTLTCPGSPGFKAASNQYGLFSQAASANLYGGPSSESRNKTPIDACYAKKISHSNFRLSTLNFNADQNISMIPAFKTIFENHLKFYLAERDNNEFTFTQVRSKKINVVRNISAELKKTNPTNLAGLGDLLKELKKENSRAIRKDSFFGMGQGLLDKLLLNLDKCYKITESMHNLAPLNAIPTSAISEHTI